MYWITSRAFSKLHCLFLLLCHSSRFSCIYSSLGTNDNMLTTSCSSFGAVFLFFLGVGLVVGIMMRVSINYTRRLVTPCSMYIFLNKKNVVSIVVRKTRGSYYYLLRKCTSFTSLICTCKREERMTCQSIDLVPVVCF